MTQTGAMLYALVGFFLWSVIASGMILAAQDREDKARATGENPVAEAPERNA